MAEQWLWGGGWADIAAGASCLSCVPSCSNLKLESRVQRQSGSWVALASSFMLLVLLNYPALAKRHVGPGPVGCSQG